MYMIYIGIAFAFAFGVGIFSSGPLFTTSDYAESRSIAIAQAIYMQHSGAVRWVEEVDSSGARIRPGFVGEISDAVGTDAINYNTGDFGDFHSIRVEGSTNADWPTITYLTPEDQDRLRTEGAFPLEPESVLRNLTQKSGANIYTIGVVKHDSSGSAHLEPLEQSAALAAPANSEWSPMQGMVPLNAAFPMEPNAPSTPVSWVIKDLPTLPDPPSDLVDGSWVLMTMTPSAP